MAKDTRCEWVVPVLEDLRKFLEDAEKPEVAREIQLILDRYSEALQEPEANVGELDVQGVVSLRRHKQRRSGT